LPELAPLPIDAHLPDLLGALRGGQTVILEAPTGAGKTTRVPPALLRAGFADAGQIVMLQPRRVAARAAAARMADEDGSALGRTFGYSVRLDSRQSAATKVLVVTEGILLRQFQHDPFLEKTGVLLFDEFHERNLQSDLALAMAKNLQQTVRPELKIVVMSATLQTDALSKYFPGAPVVKCQGRLFPVEVRYVGGIEKRPLAEAVGDAVEVALRESPGDTLVFLPGVREIRDAQETLEQRGVGRTALLQALYGDLPPDQQDAVLRRGGDARRVILSTNVAETSLTIEGVTAVVDSGLARVARYDPHVGLDKLELSPISKASAQQRAGRAGRLAPGLCLRLWNETQQRTRADFDEPEIRRVDLAGAGLSLYNWFDADPASFEWFEPPEAAALTRAQVLLADLGFIEGNAITAAGAQAAKLAMHPRLAKMLMECHAGGCLSLGALCAAMLSERGAFFRTGGGRFRQPLAAHWESDPLERARALLAWRNERGSESTPFGEISRDAARSIFRVAEQTEKEAIRTLGEPRTTREDEDEVLGRALLLAYPDRLARRREAQGDRGRMVGGRGVKLAPESGVRQCEFLVCVEIDGAGQEALVRQASAAPRAWLDALPLESGEELAFDEASGRIVARRQVKLHDLVIEEAELRTPGDARTAEILAEAARSHWEKAFPREEESVARFLSRVTFLREAMPALELPDFDAARLQALLPMLAQGKKSLRELREEPWLDYLRAELTPPQLAALEREAPERIKVPSGSQIAVAYEADRPPTLSVRIQELFGLADTPRVAGGRVKVLIQLLSPGHKPVQLTDDLKSFWANAYGELKKELKRRYPKHAWPDDPMNATPQSRPGRRG
jgi:ATP-dependent helicase HrpB